MGDLVVIGAAASVAIAARREQRSQQGAHASNAGGDGGGGAALAVMMWWLRGAEQRRSPQSGQVPPAPSSATSTRAALPTVAPWLGTPHRPRRRRRLPCSRCAGVVDAEQRPIAGARVACSDGRDLGVDQPALTQATGEFALACRHPGGARVVASKAGYGPRGGWVETGGAPIVIALAAGVTVRGEVCNAKGQAIAGAQVALALDAPLHADLVFPFDSPGRATTAGDGSFELRDLPAGRIELRATERAHDIATISLEVAPGSEGHACFTLRHVGLVEGIVVDAGNGADPWCHDQ
ncbi:MAG: carboxypeptidase-like regulatory domain-containing protein [Planctomycetota bacterium]